MKETPMLMCGDMVVATLNGTKNQTRRIMNPQPSEHFLPEVGLYHPTKIDKRTGEMYPGEEVFGAADENEDYPCRYGQPGDLIWVKETWQSLEHLTKGEMKEGPCYRATGHAANCKCPGHLWRPSIFMPRVLSRITLEIVSVRVERLKEISESDAKAEGTSAYIETRVPSFLKCKGITSDHYYRSQYQDLWESINGAGSWALNPWVWVLTFKRITP